MEKEKARATTLEAVAAGKRQFFWIASYVRQKHDGVNGVYVDCDRPVDRALQYLRKAGHIRYGKDGWTLAERSL